MHFFGSLGSIKFEIRPMSYILLCDIHHITSVLTTYHLPEYNYFTRFGKQKQKLSDQFLGVLHLMIKNCKNSCIALTHLLSYTSWSFMSL